MSNLNRSAFENKIEKGWLDRLWPFLSSDQMVKNFKAIKGRKTFNVVVPDVKDCFNAFKLTPYDETKVVILGDGPYLRDPNDGLAFSSSRAYHCPGPLAELLLEVQDDCYNGMHLDRGVNFSLEGWAKQGVLLLNTKLTTEKNYNHSEYWEDFIIEVLKIVDEIPGRNVLLIGDKKRYSQYLRNSNVFFVDRIENSRIFSSINEIIEKQNGREFCIDWSI